MNTLPNEIVVSIFKHANQPGNRLNIILVGKQWCDLFLEYVHQPWNYGGLAYAMEKGYVNYYVKWSIIAGKCWKPTMWDHYGFVMAASNDHLEMVKVLLADKKIQPFAHGPITFVSNVSEQMLELLLSDERVITHIKKNSRLYSIALNFKSRKELYYK